MKTISVYTQKDLDEIERGFDGRINIYGGDWCNPIIVSGAWENSTVVACDNSHVVARDNSTVVAYENSTVEAWNSSTVKAEVDTDMVQISATIPLELKEKMEAEKAKSGETTAELIIRVLKSL